MFVVFFKKMDTYWVCVQLIKKNERIPCFLQNMDIYSLSVQFSKLNEHNV